MDSNASSTSSRTSTSNQRDESRDQTSIRPDPPSHTPSSNSVTPPLPPESTSRNLAPLTPSPNSPSPTPSTRSSSSNQVILSRAEPPPLSTSARSTAGEQASEDSPNYPYQRQRNREDESSQDRANRQAVRKQRGVGESDSAASIFDEFESILNPTPPTTVTTASTTSRGTAAKQVNGSIRSTSATYGGSDPSPESSPDEEDAVRVGESRETRDESLGEGLTNLERGMVQDVSIVEREVID